MNHNSSFPADRNIVITGFMGTGKTTIGRLIAEQLNRRFIDMDTQIEANLGKPIPQIFEEDGEATFRMAEAKLCHQIAEEPGAVVSTGGGALVNPENRHLLSQNGVVICLTATVDAILDRIEQEVNRPLLPGDRADRGQRIRNLLHERRHAYEAIPHQVDTTGRTPEEIVQCVLDVLSSDQEVTGMTRIPVTTPDNTGYDICLGEGLLVHAGSLMQRRALRPGAVAVVSNQPIADQHAGPLMQSLEEAGYTPTLCLVPEGEAYKTLETIAGLYEQFLDAQLDRKSAVIALGGGVVGDMAGFAASTYLRGVPFVQIPTSLLSMVDASVGGKTGVDLPRGKNLVGAFKQPALVILDTGVLATLPPAEFRSGLAEVIKHGIIGAPDLFVQLEKHGPTSMTHLLADAVQVKVRVVAEDPFEQGIRAHLNLGHTFGHAIESVSNFSVRHGECVALGLIASANMAVALGRCSPDLARRIYCVVERLDLPVRLQGYSLDAVMQAMTYDKKRAGKTVRFIIPQALGDVALIDDPGREIVRAALETVLTE